MAKKRLHGEGTLYWNKTNQRWVAQVSLPNGKRRSKTNKDKKVVLDWLTEQRQKIKEGTYIKDENVKLAEFITSYMQNTQRHNLRPRTYQAHYGYVKNHIVPELGNVKLTSLRPDQVQAFYTKKLDEGLAPRTVQYIHSVLRKSLQQALKWGMVSRNVCDLVEPPRPTQKAPKILTTEQVNLFLKEVEDHQYYPIYVLAAYTGLRQSEILGLQVSDFDLTAGTLKIRRTLQYIRGKGFVTADVKTKKSKRMIELPTTAIEVMKEHLKSVKTKLVFTTRNDNPIMSGNIYRHFKRTLKKLELPDVTFHSLRHFHASMLLQAGVHPKVVQERLGHSQISTTLDIYSHTVPSMGKEAADKFERILEGV